MFAKSKACCCAWGSVQEAADCGPGKRPLGGRTRGVEVGGLGVRGKEARECSREAMVLGKKSSIARRHFDGKGLSGPCGLPAWKAT